VNYKTQLLCRLLLTSCYYSSAHNPPPPNISYALAHCGVHKELRQWLPVGMHFVCGPRASLTTKCRTVPPPIGKIQVSQVHPPQNLKDVYKISKHKQAHICVPAQKLISPTFSSHFSRCTSKFSKIYLKCYDNSLC
jgi:hypothetical protein